MRGVMPKTHDGVEYDLREVDGEVEVVYDSSITVKKSDRSKALHMWIYTLDGESVEEIVTYW
jgi:hypothetical protein